MRIHAINLDRDTDGWDRFLLRNPGLPEVVRFPAVDGAAVDRAALAGHGFLTEPLTRTGAELGRACSHAALWYRAVDTGETLTVVEDGAVLSANFAESSMRLLDRLSGPGATGWEIVVWGWSFDDVVWAEIPEGVSVCRLRFDRAEMRSTIGAFRADDSERTAVRLRYCRGSLAYTVTPAGAQALLEACIPMADRRVPFGCLGEVVDNSTLDLDMNQAYSAVRAFACIPPLAVTAGPDNP